MGSAIIQLELIDSKIPCPVYHSTKSVMKCLMGYCMNTDKSAEAMVLADRCDILTVRSEQEEKKYDQ